MREGSEAVDICVVGLGYIGLPTASIFATRGRRVLGVDVNPRIVEQINRGEIPIEEPDLEMMVQAAVQSGNLVAATEPAAADAFIIAVPTPVCEDAGGAKRPDLGCVEAAARAIAPCTRDGDLVIVESTCPVGTTERVRGWLGEELGARVEALHFVHCPERVLPGRVLRELVANDRIVGGLTREAAERACALYRCFCTGEIHVTNARTAELAKLTENASRDVGIAFANEMATICDRLGIDVWELIELANRHPRVNILRPGPGVGGHCIAVDPWFIVDSAPTESRLIQTAREVNDGRPRHVIGLVEGEAARLREPVIACLGLAFKADVDDLRESPALEIALALADVGTGELLVVEPHIDALPEGLAGRSRLVEFESALERADILVLLVDHREFLEVERTRLQRKVVIDTRGVWA